MSQAARDKDHEAFQRLIDVERQELGKLIRDRQYKRALAVAGYIVDELKEMQRD